MQLHEKHQKFPSHPSLDIALDHLANITSLDIGMPNELILQAFIADTTAAGLNTLSYREAMKADDREEFEKEMEKEIDRLTQKE